MPSAQLRKEIDSLPPWNGSLREVKSRYRAFFDKYGTHINFRIALGGVLRVTSRNDFNKEQRTVLNVIGGKASAPIAASIGVDVGVTAARKKTEEGHSSSDSGSISVFREGGNIVASDLSSIVEDIFDHYHELSRGSPRLQSWLQIQEKWIAALQEDPAVCADHPDTNYEWLHGLDGITDIQQEQLQRASEWYLRGPVGDDQPEPNPYIPSETMPRAKNLERVDDALSTRRSWWKFWKRKPSPQSQRKLH